jgi:hypothetical protein
MSACILEERLFRRRVSSASQSNGAVMADEPKRQEPEIMPPVPREEPQRNVPEIPPDKDAPEKDAPIRAQRTP